MNLEVVLYYIMKEIRIEYIICWQNGLCNESQPTLTIYDRVTLYPILEEYTYHIYFLFSHTI